MSLSMMVQMKVLMEATSFVQKLGIVLVMQ
jgi:hypothetical protein